MSIKFQDAIAQIVAMENGPLNRTLEEYLCALWQQTQIYRDSVPTWQLFADLLQFSFKSEIPAFKEYWLKFEEPPTEFWSESFVVDEFRLVEEMLGYQIADLHRMRTVGLLDLPAQELYFGVDSPTGHRWYNFSPVSFLECGAASITSNLSEKCRWRDLADFLWLGQIYE